jgi:uncharacterized peroxidase-related enzyme
MSRLYEVPPETATGDAKDLLEAVKKKFGLVPNLTRAMANSPAVLEGYLSLSGALAKGNLPVRSREQIALAVAQANSCDYCLAAHTTIGKSVGLTEAQICDSRLGKGLDVKSSAVLRLSREIVDKRGQLSDHDVQVARQAGLSDGDIAEVIGNVVLNVFTNYFNNVANTTIDFPKAPALID